MRHFTKTILVVVVPILIGGCGVLAGVDFGAAHLGPDASTSDDGSTTTEASGDAGEGGPLEAGVPEGCVPKTCAQQGFSCGTQNDGCDDAIQCGGCEGGAACSRG